MDRVKGKQKDKPKPLFKTNSLIKTDFNYRENRTRKIVMISLLIGVPLLLLIGLLINYLAYFPNAIGNNGLKQGKFLIQDNIAAFTIVIVMCTVIVIYTVFMFLSMKKRVVFDNKKRDWTLASIATVANFLDVIGVGCYAITMGSTKLTKTAKDDKKIPGTLTVGYALPQMVEATLFVGAIEVDWITLVVLVACAVVGGITGALIANKINAQIFRLTISILLFVVGIVMILVHPNVGAIKLIGGALQLRGWKMAVGAIVLFILGNTSAFGLGMSAPALAILTLLGMQTLAIFPIMSVASSGMMPAAAVKFFKDNNYYPTHSVIFSIGGTIGVIISFLVFYMGLRVGAHMNTNEFDKIMKWIAVVVVFYTSGLMFYDFAKSYKQYKWKTPIGEDVM